MKADAERLGALDEEYRRATCETLRAQFEYSELLQTHAEDDQTVHAALFRLWHVRQRQRELQVETDAWHH